MAFRIGIVGIQNSGKSFSRSFIPDGENVLVIAASFKVSYLTTTEGQPINLLDISGNKFVGWAQAQQYFGVKTNRGVINKLYPYEPGTLKRRNLPGNMIIVKSLSHLPDWIEFIDRHMPWIHTVILADFTHYISEIISSPEFLGRTIGNDAYGRYIDLAADALKGFITITDRARNNMIIVSEFHAEINPETHAYEIMVNGGKMLKEKFLPASYYDILLGTDVEYDDSTGEALAYRFVTRRTKLHQDARSMNILGPNLYIPNNLQTVLEAARKFVNIPITPYTEN